MPAGRKPWRLLRFVSPGITQSEVAVGATAPSFTSVRTGNPKPAEAALIWRDRIGALPTMATHDTALGVAGRAFGFDVGEVG
jgi:hypothetical protein